MIQTFQSLIGSKVILDLAYYPKSRFKLNKLLRANEGIGGVQKKSKEKLTPTPWGSGEGGHEIANS